MQIKQHALIWALLLPPTKAGLAKYAICAENALSSKISNLKGSWR